MDLINLQLNFGSNVVLTTTNQGPVDGGQPGNITVSAPIVKSASTTTGPGGTTIGTTSLDLRAHNEIIINPGGSITSTGDRLNVSLAANFFNPGTGTGGVAVNDAILTNGGSLAISGRGQVDINAPLSSLRTIGTGSGGGMSLSSSAGSVNVAAQVGSGGSFSASGMTGVAINGQLTAPNNSAITLFSSAGPVSVGAAVTGGAFLADGFTGVSIGGPTSANASASPAACSFSFTSFCAAGHAGAIAITAPVTGTGAAYLVADSMDIQAALNAGSAGIVALPATSGRPMNLGSEVAGSLSLTQAELSNLVTSGPKTFGSSATGAVTVSQPVSVGSSSVAVSSGTSITVNPGASLATAVPLGMDAPAMTLNGPVTAQSVILQTESLTLGAAGMVTATAGNIDVGPGFFTPINLGVMAHGVGTFDLTSAEVNKFVVTNPSFALRIGSTNSDLLTLAGPIAPTGAQTLTLKSGNGITQASGATITVPNLALVTFGDVILPEANVVSTLAAQLCCFGNTFTFNNAAATPLAIGTVDGIPGISDNFNGVSAVNIGADNLAVNAQIFAPFATVSLMPTGGGVTVDIGGADAPGRLGLLQTEIDMITADTLVLKGNTADISTDVSINNVNQLVLAPLTSARPLHIIDDPGTKNAGNLEFKQSELNRVTVNELTLGEGTTGPLTVNAAIDLTAGPGSVGKLTLRSGDTTGIGITVNAPVTANSVALIADAMTVRANVTAPTGNLIVATNKSGVGIDLGGTDVPAVPGPAVLGLDSGETELLSAPNGTLFIGNSITGDVNVSSSTFPTFLPTQIRDLNITAGSARTLTVGCGVGCTAPGSIFLTAGTIQITDDLTSTVSGNVSLCR